MTSKIEYYFKKEVTPHVPNAFINKEENIIGYEINLNKVFYEFKPLRSPIKISEDLKQIDFEINELSKNFLNE